MTSLARQLQAIRSDITATLDKRKHEKVASLLFEPKEAAYQDYGTLHAIGQNGLEGLIRLDERFHKFESTLFSVSSKDVDRAILNKKDNDNWDRVVNDFLDLVAPLALTREAVKALEWLIRRFKIHLFPATAETLLFTLLPYHTEDIFIRLIQIVALPEKFSFLSQYSDLRTSSTLPPPPRQLFIRALSKDPSFLETYFTFLVSRIKRGNGYSSMITTWSGLTIETILQMRQSRIPDETIVFRVMPFIAQGLQMRESAEFEVACYMVLTVLASKRTLAEDVINAAMDAICQGWTEESRKGAVMCLVTLARSRQGEIAFTDYSVKSLFSQRNLLSLMQKLPANLKSEGLLVPMTKKLLAASTVSEEQLALLTAILYSEEVSVSERHAVIQFTATKYSKATQAIKLQIGRWFTNLSKEHPDDFKSALLPLSNTLDPAAISELESITQLNIKESEDVEMAEVEAIESEATNPTLDLWSTLPDELSNPSFFVSTPESTAVLNLFQEVVISGNSIQQEKLLSSPLLTKSPITLPSIFARVWTTLSYPLRVRQLALTHFSTFLSSPPFSHDFQGFIPHLIVALSDSSDSIRAAAASSVRVLYNRYLNASTKSTPVGLSDMYPEEEGSGGLKWLSTAEAKWLVSETLVERLPECEIDGNIIVRLIGGLLNGAGKKGKKEHNPSAVMVFLASHVVCSGSSYLQYSLLRILNDYTVEKSAALKLKAQSLEPFLIRCKDTQYVSAMLNQEKDIDASEFKRMLVQVVGPGSSAPQINLLLDLVRSHGPLSSFACQQLVIVFPSTSHTMHLQIAKLLLNQLETASSALAKVASTSLSSISLPTNVILSLMEDVKIEVDDTDNSPARKRQRTDSARSSPGTVPEGLLQSTRRLTLLLEVLEKQDSEQQVPVIAPLFAMLDRLIVVETDTRSSLNYPKQMVLSCLISIVTGLKGTPIAADPNSFRIDTLIACIRTSTNPQVHNRSLLLLSALTQVVPDLILNHVMPIFTFMGANVLRQDDEYSAHVIEQTIKSVVPMLVGVQTGQTAVKITPVISAFVVNFDFIPRHRRLSLFRVLLETLGPEKHLSSALLQFGEKGSQAKDSGKAAVTEFAADLINSFPLATRLTAIDSFLKLVVRISRYSENENSADLPLDVTMFTEKQVADLIFECLRILVTEITSRSFQTNVAHAFSTGDISFLQNDFFSPIVENLLLLEFPGHQGSSRTLAAQDLEILISQALDGVLSALPLQTVANIVENFLETKRNIVVTGNMIAIATDRLARDNTADITVKPAVTLLLKSLKEIITSVEDEEATVLALESLAKLSRVHGKAELPVFEEVVPALVHQGIANENKIIKEAAVDCLHSMLPVLGARVLPFLPEIMPIILEELTLPEESASSECQLNIFILLTGLYERIPNFVASYVARITKIIVTGQFSDILEAQAALVQAITTNVDTEVCVEALTETWPIVLVEHNRYMLDTFITILERVIVVSGREDLTSSSRLLFALFLNLFDIRSEERLKLKTLKKLEAQLTEVFLKLVMKLNDTTFRPFFITLRDWTFRNVVPERKLSRQIFFYTFVNKFVDVLQTVVTAYYGIILDDTVQLLNDFVSGTVRSKELWKLVINSLQKSFQHDLTQDSYWSSPTRFDKIILPLLSQLSLSFKSSPAIQAIAALASKAHSEENCKVINDALIEYMKSETVSVRLAAINTQRELYSEISHEWLKMLPPTVPIISEVMEDEDDNVIEAAHELIQTIEKVGGISMQKLLT